MLVLICILSFAYADGQTSTIKVRKSKCECNYIDTSFVKNIDLSKTWNNSQKSVTVIGTVITDTVTKSPLGGATIWYTTNGKKKKVVTNPKGEFIILNAPLAVYDFYVSYPCYTNGGSKIGPYPSATSVPATFVMIPCKNYNLETKKVLQIEKMP